ncbi:MAG: hypothetical protein KGH60_02875 [Candidatus Micrarchaeota archaeon]|nr:hypothetical protein [Candidatus Micrarchaeota archaeon]
MNTSYLKDRRILTLFAIVAILAILDVHYGIHFGIEFAGGTQIPITLTQPANTSTMQALQSDLQQRASTFGLKQVKTEPIGDSLIYLQIATVSQSEINQTIGIIQNQGIFQGIVAGKVAVNGTGILHGSIGQVPPQQINNSVVEWAVNFYLTQNAANYFAKQAFGQANQPLYLFLNRPQSTVILINSSILGGKSSGLSPAQALTIMQQALRLGNQSIPVLSVSGNNASISSVESFFTTSKGKYNTVIASKNINSSLISLLESENYTVKLESNANMTPQYIRLTSNNSLVATSTIINAWPVVGLLSAPVLNPQVTNGNVTQSYQISGPSPSNLSLTGKVNFAQNQTKQIASILSGGALPVAVVVGTPTTFPASLGKHFLYVSAEAGVIAVIAVSAFIILKYRKIFLVTPILLTTFAELFIIFSIIGLIGTIDLAAVAGMIAVVGTGVDAQIIITDEILVRRSGGETSTKSLLGNAFYIIWMDAALLIIAMLPLFFSTSLVDVIGFSESTIIGALLGVLITRPAYSAILSKHFT